MDSSELKLLTTTSNHFEAQVITALLQTEGIVSHFNKSTNPYPIPQRVEIFVSFSDFTIATGILLINQVEDIFDPAPKTKVYKYPLSVKISSVLLLILLLLSALNIA